MAARALADETQPPLPAKIATVLDEEIGAGRLPGAVIVAGEHGRVVYRGAFGERAVAPEPLPMIADTIFDLASLTKVVATTTAVMQLVDAGRLRLRDPVSRYWSAFARNGKQGITVEQLLTHTSGLRPDFDLKDQWAGDHAARARVEAERPAYAPGARFLYSDINFIALGELIQRVTGQSLDVYAARHIFGPLGMTDTRFRPAPSLRDRIAPTDYQDGVLRWGEVQDPTAHRMGGVAGHAGLFATADDLAIFAQMLLNGGTYRGKRILSVASVRRMTSPHTLPGGIQRGLGWDMNSPYTAGQDSAFGPASFGHTGYTGTSLWVDPKRRGYLIVLTSRLHPNDRGNVKPLIKRVAEIVAAADTQPPVLTGIDVLEAEGFASLEGRRVGLLTNQTGRDRAGRRTIDILAHAPGVKLRAILSPEHGLDANREGRIASGTDSATGLPIYSLYGANLRPSETVLSRLDALVVDLQDVGVRFYTYATTMAYAMEAAARAGVSVYVLDRPNPITADIVDGPVLERRLLSFTGYFPMPVQHGMTLGELADMFNAENKIGAKLTVVPMRSYRRNLWYDQTGLEWINPSPNLRSLDQAILYPGVALIEATNVSVGRGTARPFELIGAPWIDGQVLANYLNGRAIPGVRFNAAEFVPAADRYSRVPCRGVRITLTDRSALKAPYLGVELASALRTLYPGEFQIARTLSLIGSEDILKALENGTDPRLVSAQWRMDVDAFKELRAKYLLYP
jgi:uncharacterized protein YbbC (DUF1343 family)